MPSEKFGRRQHERRDAVGRCGELGRHVFRVGPEVADVSCKSVRWAGLTRTGQVGSAGCSQVVGHLPASVRKIPAHHAGPSRLHPDSICAAQYA